MSKTHNSGAKNYTWRIRSRLSDHWHCPDEGYDPVKFNGVTSYQSSQCDNLRKADRWNGRRRGFCLQSSNGRSETKKKLENAAIATALQFEVAGRRAVPIRFNFVARVKFELALPIRCSLRAFLLLIRYITVWPWTMTCDLDLWPWTCVVDRLHHGQMLYEIWAKSAELLQFEYLSFNLMTLNMYHVLCYAVG